MQTLAIIGGTGLTEFNGLNIIDTHSEKTELGYPSSAIRIAEYKGQKLLFLARHGHPHKVPPHKINYRANLLALQSLGAQKILAVNAVGGITEAMSAERLCVPDQIVDYTWGREATFFDGDYRPLDHVDFSFPYHDPLRQELLRAAQSLGLDVAPIGTYAATQGPRLESIAEIKRLENDGCDLVGMTGMPEAVLARELDIPYASLCLVVNKAAGKSDGIITMDEIYQALENGMAKAKQLILQWVANQQMP